MLCSLFCLSCSPANVSVDLAAQYQSGVYGSVGLSHPLGPVYVGAGVWTGTDFSGHFHGGYATVSKSFKLKDKK